MEPMEYGTDRVLENLRHRIGAGGPGSGRHKGADVVHHVFIHKSYFPKAIWPDSAKAGDEAQEQWKVKAPDRTTAAKKVWDTHGERLLGMMTPQESSMVRKVSLHVSGTQQKSAPGRLTPVLVYKGWAGVNHRYRGIETYSPDEERDEKGRWTSGSIGEDKIERSPFKLTDEQRAAETRFRSYVGNHTKEAADEYRNGKDGRKGFGNVLNADDAKSLSKDFQKDPAKHSVSAHEPASYLINKVLYPEILKEPVPAGKSNSVLFTAGGGGAGKSSGLAASPALEKLASEAHIVLDGTFTNAHKAESKIDMALAAGKKAVVIFVHRDPVDAMLNGVVSRANPKTVGGPVGRVVPLEEFANQHSRAQAAMAELAQHYKDNPNFQLHVVDNSYGKGAARISTLKDLAPAQSKADILRTVGDALKAHLESGKMKQEVYDVITQKETK